MSQSNISVWLQFALQQMAAESYLDGINFNNAEQVKAQLRLGNNRSGFPERGATRFTGTATQGLQDRAFVDRYQIVDHHANDATGFSATLMKDRTTGEYTLSFRSLEYQDQAKGGDWERDGVPGAAGEIAAKGFALGQLVSMERYYQELKANPSKLPSGAILNVTGYSLGGHLATIFTELHSAEIQHTYTFNAAGRGLVGGITPVLTEATRIQQLVDAMDAKFVEFDPSGALLRSGASGSIYPIDWYRQASVIVTTEFQTTGTAFLSPGGLNGGVTRNDGAFEKITQLFGSSVTGGDLQLVANSGVHGPVQPVLIEGQPLLEGVPPKEFIYGNAHSITLIVDSLALQALFEAIDPDLAQSDIENIFKAASVASADALVVPGEEHTAEGDTLEQALDMLRRLFLPSNPDPKTNFNDDTGGFGDLGTRNEFYAHLEQMRTALNNQTYSIEPLVQVTSQGNVTPRLTASELKAAAKDQGTNGLAYRYALHALNPFAVVGVDYDALGHTASGQLALYDALTGVGEMTDKYLDDRAAFLLAQLDLALANLPAPLIPSLTHYHDVTTGLNVPSTLPLLQREFLFGGSDSDVLEGSILLPTNDHLYGGASADQLYGHSGDDYLQGDSGNDRLIGGTGSDQLVGGLGFDTYEFDSDGIDIVEDGDDRGMLQVDGKLTIGGIHRAGDTADTYKSSDGQFTFVRSGNNLTINNHVTIQNWQQGDLGIMLRDLSSLLDGTAPVINYDNGLPTHFTDVSTATASFDIGPIGGAGLAFNEVVLLGSGNDSVFANSASLGNHQFHGGAGNDVLEGALGNDRLYGDAGRDLLWGDDGDDVLEGGNEQDILLGHGGNDSLTGGSGDDFLQGGLGQDILIGGDGADTLLASATNVFELQADFLDGGPGADFLWGGQGDDVLLGGSENDTLRGDNLLGPYTNLTWQAGVNPQGVFTVLPPEMQVRPEGGMDYLDGGAGDDVLYGEGGDDVLLGGSENDTLYGDVETLDGVVSGKDFLDGGTGNDLLQGGGQADTLFGGDDNDTLIGDFVNDAVGANDWLDGGTGNDTLVGGRGDDVLLGGAGLDILFGNEGQDVLDGGSGNDELQGGSGTDQLWGGIGNDRLFGENDNDELFGGEGADILVGDAGTDLLVGGSGPDTLQGGAGQDTYVFNLGDGVDTISDLPGEGNKLVFGPGVSPLDISLGLGSLLVRVGSNGDAIHIEGFNIANPTESGGIDVFEFSDGTTLSQAELLAKGFDLLGTAENDVLDGKEVYRGVFGLSGNDGLSGGMIDNVLDGGDGSDVIFGNGGADQLFGGTGDDVMRGGEGNDVLHGDPGNDSLEGEAGDDVLAGGTGDDQLLGGPGADTYVFNLGDGIDSISDSNAVGEESRVVFGPGVIFSSVTLTTTFGQVLVRPGAAIEGVTIGVSGDNVLGPHAVDRFEFVDGTSITYADLVLRGFDIDGTAGDDTLSGTNISDRFRGGAGNDSLEGGSGNDTYIFNLGDGVDTIRDMALPGAENEISFGLGISSADLSLGLVADQSHADQSNLLLHIAPGSAAIQLDTFDRNDVLGLRTVDAFYFADGSSLSYSQLVARGFDLAGTDGDDQLVGTNLNDRIIAGDGNDAVRSGTGDDTIDSGLGNDRLWGGPGSDTYMFGPGSGQDTVLEFQGNQDTIRMAAGVSASNVVVTRNSDDLVLSLNAGSDQITVSSYFSALPLRIERVLFADGTVWDQSFIETLLRPSLIGTGGSDTLVGTSGNDLLVGLAGDDQVMGFAGDDLLDGGTGADQLAGGLGNDVYVLDDANDAVIEQLNEGIDIVQSSMTTTLASHVEQLTLMGNASINGVGNELNNILEGNSAVNVLSGGVGNDTYVVGEGDTIIELTGEGTDTVQTGNSTTLGANLENLTLTGSASRTGTGNGLDNVLRADGSISILAGGGGNDTYLNGDDDILVEQSNDGIDTVIASHDYRLPEHVENVTLLDPRLPDFSGFSSNFGMLQMPFPNTQLVGTGNDLANVLTGGRIDNRLDGGLGADTMIGGTGDDVYIVDVSADVVVEKANAGLDTVETSTDYILPTQVEVLNLVGNGSINGTGNGMNNILVGNAAANILDGGAGNDFLNGQEGSDTFLFGMGSGQDAVVDETSVGNVDTIQLGSGLTTSQIAVVQRGSDLVLNIVGTNDEMVLANFYAFAEAGFKQVRFGDGTIWDATMLRTLASPSGSALSGGAGDEALTGGIGNDSIVGNAGNDVLMGALGSDVLFGDALSQVPFVPPVIGNDTLLGGPGDDFLTDFQGTNLFDGGSGNDSLAIGAGQDTIVFGRGSGSDVVQFDGNGTDMDLIQLAADLSPDDVSLTRQYPNGNILELTIRDTGEKLTLNLSTNYPSVDPSAAQAKVMFADGTQWDLSWVSVDPNVGSTGNDVLVASFPATLTGLSGDDIYLVGSSGVVGIYAVVEAVDEGLDTVQSLFNYTLDANVENLVLLESSSSVIANAERGIGNELDNLIIGNTADNILNGGSGNDVLIGGFFRSVENRFVDQTGSDILIGGAGDDILTADGGNIVIPRDRDGSAQFRQNVPRLADDLFIGGIGNDTYILQSQQETIVESANEGTDMVQSTVDYVLGANLENLTLLDNSVPSLPFATIGIGNDLDNVLIGNMASNELIGGYGDDTLWGGVSVSDDIDEDLIPQKAGNDHLVGGVGSDTYLFNIGDGTDTIDDQAVTGQGNRIQFGTGITRSDLTFTEDQAARTLTIQIGTSGSDRLLLTNFDPTSANGSLVVETLAFADGSTARLASLLGIDGPVVTTGDDTIATGVSDDVIDALGGNDVVDTGAGNDTLTGGPGNDTLSGGAGDDTYHFNLGDGVDTINDITAAGEGNTLVFGTGIAPADLSLSLGSLLLRVGTGGELIHLSPFDPTNAHGPHAIETFRFADGTVLTYSQLIGLGFDLTGTLGDDTMTGTNVVDRVSGLAGNDILQTGMGDDVLDGGSGVDSMRGGIGNDIYLVDNGGDIVAENVNEGTDTVQSSINYALGANVENLALRGTGALHGTGNAQANVLTGNSGNNVLDGAAGADIMAGGTGDDTYMVDNAGDVVTEQANNGLDTVQSAVTYTLSVNVENLTLVGVAAINGTGNELDNFLTGNSGANVLTSGTGDDILLGNAGNDTLLGGAGNDRVDGGTGSDAMTGGTGNDIYIVDATGDTVTEAANEGTDMVESSITYTLGANVENLTLMGAGAINGTGNSLDNMLLGNNGINTLSAGGGNDTLNGGAGADVLSGGAGNDTYVVDNMGDTISESSGQGTDTVQSSITYMLGSNVENLTLTGTANINGMGSSSNNILVGNSGNNVIDGGSGNDTMDGGDGNDSLLGGAGNDALAGGNGNDSLDGGSNDDALFGATGNDTLSGGSGNDNLDGGLGDDSLDAGSGDDRLTGGGGRDILLGGSGNDQLTGGVGNDILQGGSGNDIYLVARGDGQDGISDNDATPGNTDKVLYGAGINPLDLMISRQANDLRLTIYGGTDQLTIQNWYTSTNNQTEAIQAGNGQQLLNTKVDQLIQAMAVFGAQTGLTWEQAIAQRPQDVQNILAASWQ